MPVNIDDYRENQIDDTRDELEGYVTHITFRNKDNGYTVLELEMNDGNAITCVGKFATVSEGENLLVRGNYIEHPTYGIQLQVTSYEETIPTGREAIKRYLGSGAIKGVGPAIASRIVKKFGEKTFEIMENEPERLAEIKGISMNRAMEISDQMIEKRDIRESMMFLAQYGIQGSIALKLYERYGANLRQTLENNPYQIAEDIRGVGFRTADEIARKLGVSKDSEFRVRCGILYVLQNAAGNGHTFLPKVQLITELEDLLGMEVSGAETQLMNLVMDRKIRLIDDEEVYLTSYYNMESYAARRLLEIDAFTSKDEARVTEKIREIEEKDQIELDDVQREAVIAAATHGVFILTGGPGTGKTTTTRVMIQYFIAEGLDVLLAAPTGRAAKRMSEATGYQAKTIHRLLEVHGQSDDEMEEDENRSFFDRNAANPLEADVIIIDEMSMVDIALFRALLSAIPDGARLILVGDTDQLPSVGAGNVLKDLIASDVFHRVTLSTVFRQAETSDIVMNAHRIKNGEMVEDKNSTSSDFFFMERSEPNAIRKLLVQLVGTNLPKYVGAGSQDIQVLTPMRKSVLGAEGLNRDLQRYINPESKDKQEYVFGETTFREGDKVMQIKNNYQLPWEVRGVKGIVTDSGMGVFNGDMGVVQEINLYTSKMTVAYEEDHLVEYDLKDLSDLELSYAVTVHKSQGSEYPAVVIPLLQVPGPLMTRNILYTAVTRAKKCVVIVGSKAVFYQMIQNAREDARYSGLRDRIEEELEKISSSMNM